MDITVEQEQGQTVMTLVGDLDNAVAYLLYEQAVDLFGAEEPAQTGGAVGAVSTLVVDLAGVPFTDSTGLGALIRMQHLVDRHGATLVLRGVQPSVRRLLEITGLDRTFELA